MAAKVVHKIQPNFLASLLKFGRKLLIYDVRDSDYGELGIIKNSINLPYFTINESVIESIIDKSIKEQIEFLVCYCKYGRARSVMAATKIAEKMSNFDSIPKTEVGYLIGGIGSFMSFPENLQYVELESKLLE